VKCYYRFKKACPKNIFYKIPIYGYFSRKIKKKLEKVKDDMYPTAPKADYSLVFLQGFDTGGVINHKA